MQRKIWKENGQEKVGRGDQEGMSLRKAWPSAGRLVDGWHLFLPSPPSPYLYRPALPWNQILSLFRLTPPPKKFKNPKQTTPTTTPKQNKTKKSQTKPNPKIGQLQGSKFQVWLHLWLYPVPAFNGDMYPPLKIPSDTLRNSFHFSFLQILYLSDKQSFTRKGSA